MYTHTYTFVSIYPTLIYIHNFIRTIYTCKHAYIAVPKLLFPTACSHLAVIHSSYLGVEAFDPYITIQVNSIHTIARRMDDEVKTPMLVLK